jgi:hypothetical protein
LPAVIEQLKRIGAPRAYRPRRKKDPATRAVQRRKVDQQLAHARDRMTWPDVPTRVLVRALVTTARPDPHAGPKLDRVADLADRTHAALPMARALLARSDELTGTDTDIVEALQSTGDVNAWLRASGLGFAELPECHADVVGKGRRRVLDVTTTGRRTEPVEVIWPCIQPLNWPRCNELFHSVSVLPGSFTDKPDLVPFASVLPAGVPGKRRSIYGCSYVEVVELSQMASGGMPWFPQNVTTTLDAIEWQRRDQSGELTEVGMAYRHRLPDKAGDGVVDIDEGYAILTRDAGSPEDAPTYTLTTRKRISFTDPAALDLLEAEPVMCELFSLDWAYNFELTTEECEHRAVVREAEVRHLSSHPGMPPPGNLGGPGSAGTGAAGDWLVAWLEEASAYWQDAASVGFRELQRLEERRSTSDPTRSEDMFYDALEVWEANRRSLNDGLELTAKFWNRLMGGV